MSDDLIYRLRKRAEIRRNIPHRKSVQNNEPDRIADLLEEAANAIEELFMDQLDGALNNLVEGDKNIARNCIFELVHESTLQSNKEVQDFTVRVAERIKKKYGIE